MEIIIKQNIIPIYNCFHPILREKGVEVIEQDERINQLIADMKITMMNADGIGLAANQVGDRSRLFVIDINAGSENGPQKPYTMINPTITSHSDEITSIQEGCLSIPYVYENIDRPEAIEVTYFDDNFASQTIQAGGILARVIMHELDHLNGILFIDKITNLQRAMAKNKLNKILKNKIIPKYDMIDKDGILFQPDKIA